MLLEMKKCKQWLAIVWFIGAAIISSVVIVQSILGRYGNKESEAIGWLLPTVMPTLSLMIAVFAAEALKPGRKGERVDSFMFWLNVAISVFYLSVVAATIFLSPFATIGPLALMKMSNLWLGPCQGLAAAGLGVFFVNSQVAGSVGGGFPVQSYSKSPSEIRVEDSREANNEER
ncbi:MAG TPA: hypothetical protein VJZ71_06310 [Phycisphaerae bacterium]|nr:hypothetical protein [Phycisphaerae bacterium]